MEKLVEKLTDIEGIKTVKRQGENLLKIEPFSKPLKHQEAKRITGNLRKITPKIKNVLDNSEEVEKWEWNTKPEKKYQENKVNSVTDRKAKGHKPAYYLITIHQ